MTLIHPKDLERARKILKENLHGISHDSKEAQEILEPFINAIAQALADERERAAKIAQKFYITSGYGQWTYGADIESAIRQSEG